MQDMAGLLNATGNPLSGFGYYPRWQSDAGENRTIVEESLGGDIFLNASYYAADPSTIAPGIRGYSILLHEIGHALGFKHPFEGDPTIDPAHDSGAYTIMSYDRPRSTTSLGPVDIEASQIYYGSRDLDFHYDPAKLELTIAGTSADDHIIGTNINDVVTGSGGNDRIEFGKGTDTAVMFAARSSANLTKTNEGYSISSGEDGSDTLIDVERIKFSDGTLALDIDGIAGQAYRIYKAAFARTPDNDGLKCWINAMDQGATLTAVAAGFVKSAEFESVYGTSPTNRVIVEKLYQNVLGRDGESGGVGYWVGELDSGNKDAVAVLAGFSESPENITGVSPAISDGIFFV